MRGKGKDASPMAGGALEGGLLVRRPPLSVGYYQRLAPQRD